MAENILRVLIVDDSALMRQMVKSSVHSVGITDVTEARDGKAALALLEIKKFDILILDWVMPEVTGIEVAQTIRTGVGVNKDIPIMMVTAEASKDEVQKIAALKINGYVVKPFTGKTLEKKLSILVKRIKANRGS